ncbi:MAG: nucleotidyl transferase AbiEii/AbiGii toxin family protein, partial [Gemmatimonadetes bacterium]|nr:nucleotidyl transferase AbiEii/AbiGii toxin family protein [Gemmatimonadota bacterium]
MLRPRVDVLPPAQRRLWPELHGTPRDFVLYGGTALALRLAHRQSDDFDFFSSAPVDSTRLLREVPYLAGAEVLRRSPDTLTCLVDRGGPVRVSFFGGLTLRRVADPETLAAPAVAIAGLLDLAATKAEVVQARAAAKDYLDLDALVHRAGVSLAEALGAAVAVFGPAFNPLSTVKALCFFGDGDLAALPQEVRRRLI